jgi:hypothetical protein
MLHLQKERQSADRGSTRAARGIWMHLSHRPVDAEPKKNASTKLALSY